MIQIDRDPDPWSGHVPRGSDAVARVFGCCRIRAAPNPAQSKGWRAGFSSLVLACLLLSAAVSPARAEVAAITSQNAGRLTLIDPATLAVLAEVPLPGKPAAVAVDGARGRIFAIAVETARLHVFDLSGQQIAAHPLEGAPFGVAVEPETGAVLVTDWQGWLREIDPETGAERARWPVGAVPSGVAAEAGVIVTADRDADSATIVHLDPKRDHAADRRVAVPVGHHPFGVTLYGGRAFVTNVLSDSVSVIDLASDKVIATLPTGERPYALAFAAGRGFVTNQYASSLTVFDAATLAPLGEIATDDYPEGIAATVDGGRILVANWFSDTVQVIDPVGLSVIDTLDMPEGPRAFGAFIGGP